MNKTILFAKRNFKEMLRDPLLYIFCAGFPVFMILMFQIILHYTGEETPVFQVKSLVPGIMMFSYSLLMLMSALLISKDKTQAFLKRLFTSPMKAHDYIIGYFIPYFLVGIIQSFICVILGYIFGAVNNTGFIPFSNALLLIVEMMPMMMINIFIGITFGILLNDKAAPAVTSIFISCCGILGGAWMPLDAMGEFEAFASCMPFYPSVYLGRVVTGASHTIPDNLGNMVSYNFDDRGLLFLFVILGYLVLTGLLATFIFNKKLKSDN